MGRLGGKCLNPLVEPLACAAAPFSAPRLSDLGSAAARQEQRRACSHGAVLHAGLGTGLRAPRQELSQQRGVPGAPGRWSRRGWAGWALLAGWGCGSVLRISLLPRPTGPRPGSLGELPLLRAQGR